MVLCEFLVFLMALSFVATHKGTPAGVSSAAAQKSYPRSCYVPWRTAARAGRQR